MFTCSACDNGTAKCEVPISLEAYTDTLILAPAEQAMFLKILHDDDASLIEALDLKQLFDPFTVSIPARIHAGEELQDPQTFPKSDLFFPSGESLPRCWLDPHYQS